MPDDKDKNNVLEFPRPFDADDMTLEEIGELYQNIEPMAEGLGEALEGYDFPTFRREITRIVMLLWKENFKQLLSAEYDRRQLKDLIKK